MVTRMADVFSSDLGLRCASDPAGCLTRGHQCAHHTAEGDIARFVETKVDERCDAGQKYLAIRAEVCLIARRLLFSASRMSPKQSGVHAGRVSYLLTLTA